MAVKTYSLAKDGNTSLSAHFKVSEFASTSGSKIYTDKILIDSDLINMLEKLFSTMNLSKLIITSGYRCKQHDIAVGGTGSGMHVSGKAADIICYDNKNNIVNSKYVCCIAADLGFGGVANIKDDYHYTHVDVRSGSKYYGDESIKDELRYRSIWYRNSKYTDFYKYFNLTKAEVSAYCNSLKTENTTKVQTSTTKNTSTNNVTIVDVASTLTRTESTITKVNYKVKVTSSDGFVNVRKTPKFSRTDIVSKINNSNIKYTIIQETTVDGYKFGKLKSGAGWIALSCVTKC